MNDYQAPLADMKFVLRELVDHELLAQLPGFGDLTPDVAGAVLDEAAFFLRSTAAAIWRARAGRMAGC
jgi:3-(methylthio)propanoyl-CoA dehydrogenase